LPFIYLIWFFLPFIFPSFLRASFEIRKLNAKKKTVSFAYFLGDTEKNL